MRSVEDINRLQRVREKAQAGPLDAMRLLEAYLRNELPIAVAELDMNDQAAIANLAGQGLEQMSLRGASTLPSPECPPVRPNIKESVDKARKRKQFALGCWEANAIEEVLFLRFEHLFGHAVAPVTVLPDPSTGIARWEVRDPKSCFPAPCRTRVDVVPPNCIFTGTQPWGWVRDRYPNTLDLRRPESITDDDPVTIVEYIDDKEIVTLARWDGTDRYDMLPGQAAVELDRIKNKAMTPLSFVPGWDTIVGRRGRFGGTIGAHQMRAKLLAIAYITARKGAFPDPWIQADGSGVQPEILRYPDPKTGEPGVVKGGTVTFDAPQPGFMTSPMLSILEREIRMEGGIPAEFGGESPTAVRTGRRGDAVLASTIDFPIQRAQKVLARSLGLETRAAICIAKSWTTGPRSFYVNWKGAQGQVDYDPAKDFDSDHVIVKYSLAGSDLNNDLLRGQSKVGTGIWSRQTYREHDPETEDAEREGDRVVAERLFDSFLAALDQKIGAPDSRWGPRQVAELRKLIITDRMEAEEAVAKIEEEMAEAQAEAAPPPDALPGSPSIPAPPEGLQNLGRFQQVMGSIGQRVA